MQGTEDNKPAWSAVLERASRGNRGRSLFQAVPFFFSALLFLSGLLAVTAPLPLLLLAHEEGRKDFKKLGWALLINTLFVGIFSKSVPQTAFFVLTVLPMAFGIPYLFERARLSFDRVIVTLWGLLILGVGAFLLLYPPLSVGVSPLKWMGGEIRSALEVLTKAGASLPKGMSTDELVKNVLYEMPSALGLFLLMMSALNTLLFLSWSRASYFQRIKFSWKKVAEWKAPELLVWPTLFAGAGVVFEAGTLSIVANNFLRLLLAVYAAQGLCILWTMLESVKIRGGLRVFLLGLSAIFVAPLVIAAGFFDLWIDIRAKLRQS